MHTMPHAQRTLHTLTFGRFSERKEHRLSFLDHQAVTITTGSMMMMVTVMMINQTWK